MKHKVERVFASPGADERDRVAIEVSDEGAWLTMHIGTSLHSTIEMDRSTLLALQQAISLAVTALGAQEARQSDLAALAAREAL